jgi:hypothetical protein
MSIDAEAIPDGLNIDQKDTQSTPERKKQVMEDIVSKIYASFIVIVSADTIVPADTLSNDRPRSTIAEKAKFERKIGLRNLSDNGAKSVPVPGKSGSTPAAGKKGKWLARQGESSSIKIVNGQKVQSKIQAGKEEKQALPGMAKDLDPRNRAQPKKKVRAGRTVAKAPRIVSSGVSLKPELMTHAAAVEAVRHNPKVPGKEEARVYQGLGHGQK